VVTYTVTDGLGPNVTSTLTLTVNPVNDNFTDASEVLNVNQGTPLTGNVINGSSVDGPISVTSFSVAPVVTDPNVQVAATGFNEALPAPLQTYFVPFPETPLLTTLNTIQSGVSPAQDVRSIISIAVAATGTVIYYDHWEDGYEANVRNPLLRQSTTQIWGDGNTSNGTAPGEADDIFEAGDAFVLDNVVDLTPSRNASQIFFDGADRVQASSPISMSRGAWALDPGSLFAGGTEVRDTDNWGTEFVVPFGENTVTSTNNPLEYTALYVMAAQPNTQVFLNNVLKATLGAGENYVTRVNEDDRLTTSKPVQVNMATGDIGSTYEMRWSTLAPLAQWDNDYYSPVGTAPKSDGGSTKVWLYNPNNFAITVSYDFLGGGVDGTITIAANSVALSPDVPNNSGARFFTTSGDKFLPLSYTDINPPATSPTGDLYEWATSLVPASKLTYQAIVSWGYGTTNPNGDAARSVVFVTPTAQTDIWVDYDGAGVRDPVKVVDNAAALSSTKLVDPVDQDMTGAIVYTLNEAGNGPGANIVVAWGQDPARSGSGDSQALDLGTLVAPLPIVDAGTTARLFNDADGNGYFSPGDTIEYTINIVNSGRVALPAGSFKALVFTNVAGADLLDSTTYIAGSTTYQGVAVADSTTGTLLPLDDDSGLLNPIALGVGGTHTIKFKTQINSFAQLPAGTDSIVNKGQISPSGAVQFPLDTFEAQTPLSTSTFNAGQTATISGVGTLQINANGTFTFTPVDNYYGPVPVVTYTLTDGLGPTNASNFSITVNPGPASLGDRVWEDSNNNGIQDAGEAGFAGIIVTLTGGGADGIINGIGDTTTTTTTNANGLYSFTGLAHGQQYQVGFSNLPVGYRFTQVDANGNSQDAVDSDVNPTTGKTQIMTLAAGANNTTIDAGIYNPTPGITDLSQLYGNPTSMTFTYLGGALVSTGGKDNDKNGLGDQDGKAKIESGLPDNDPSAYIVVAETNNVADIKDGSKKVYFGGTVQIGQSFTASLNFANEDKFQADTRILIFEDEASFIAGSAPLQVSVYKTDGSQPITRGDVIGGSKLVEYQGATGGYDDPNVTPLMSQVGRGFSMVGLFGKATEMTFRYDASTVLRTGGKNNTQDGRAKILGTRSLDNDGTSFIRISDKSDPNDVGGKEFFEGLVSFGQQFMASVFAPTANTTSFSNDLYIHYFNSPGSGYLGSAVYKTDGSQPMELGDQLAGATLVRYNGTTGSSFLQV
jgi:hypothetical protein